MRLAHAWPARLSGDARLRVDALLLKGCERCESQTANLVRRSVGGGQSIYLQCSSCGSALGNPLSRQQHPNWPDYPVWDDGLVAARRQTEAEERRSKYEIRKAEYREFLKSDEWRLLRARVIRRAGGLCESCLSNAAQEVHHESYEHGWAPPAWFLKAVCIECHDKLHGVRIEALAAVGISEEDDDVGEF